jgi:hypothetical protein
MHISTRQVGMANSGSMLNSPPGSQITAALISISSSLFADIPIREV